MTQTIIIVGAGLTGLVTALRLQQADKTVRVLEARDRVGGRTYTTTISHGGKQHHFDYGAHFIGNDPAQQPIWDLVKELGLETFEQYEGPENAKPPPFWAGEAANLQYFHGAAKAEAYIGSTIPDDPAAQFYLYYLDQLMSGVRLDAPERTDNAEKLDALSVWDWVSKVNLPGYGPAPDQFKSLTRMLCRVGFSTEPENISMLWLLYYVASSGGLARFQDLRWPLQGAQGYRLVKGAQSIAEALAARLTATDPKALMVGMAVTGIDNGTGGVSVRYSDGLGHDGALTGDRAVMALAPAVAAQIPVSNPGPARAGLAGAMQNSHMIMSFATFRTAFWRDDTTSYTKGKVNGIPQDDISRYGLSGDVLLADEDVVWIMDNSSSEGLPALFAFIVGDAARKWAPRTSGERRDMVVKYMRQMFGAKVDAEILNYYEHDWNQDDFSMGCPAGHFTPGSFLKYADTVLLNRAKSHGGLYHASTETALRSNGYMSGAVWSGETVARQIIADLDGRPAPRDPAVRAQAMRYCVNRVIQAVQTGNPMLEASIITDDNIFTPPGGKAFGGSFKGMPGTVAFFVKLGSEVTIDSFTAEGISVCEQRNIAFARVTVSGRSNVTGTPFAGLGGTMAFLFNDADAPETLIAHDMLLLDTPLADEIVLGIPQPTAAAPAPAAADGAPARLFDIEALAASLSPGGGGEPLITDATVIRGPGGSVCPAAPALGGPALGELEKRLLAHVSDVRQIAGTLDPQTRSMFALFEIKGQGATTGKSFTQPLIVDIRLSNGSVPHIASLTLRTDATTLDG